MKPTKATYEFTEIVVGEDGKDYPVSGNVTIDFETKTLCFEPITCNPELPYFKIGVALDKVREFCYSEMKKWEEPGASQSPMVQPFGLIMTEEYRKSLFPHFVFNPEKGPEPPKPKPKPVFTSHDGVPLYEGRTVHWINKRGLTYGQLKVCADMVSTEAHIFFASKEKADEYILRSTPCLSLNDLLKCWGKEPDDYFFSSPLFRDFEATAKTKIHGEKWPEPTLQEGVVRFCDPKDVVDAMKYALHGIQELNTQKTTPEQPHPHAQPEREVQGEKRQ